MMLTIKSLALFAITSTLSTADVDARIGANVDENNGQSRHLLPSEENLELFHKAAIMSKAVYFEDKINGERLECEQVKEDLGGGKTECWATEEGLDAAAVIKHDGICFAVYRGTRALKGNTKEQRDSFKADAMQSFDKNSIIDADGCQVRRGFNDIYYNLRPFIMSQLYDCEDTCGETVCPIVLTGHSKGGAVAVVASKNLPTHNILKSDPYVITFGAPAPFITRTLSSGTNTQDNISLLSRVLSTCSRTRISTGRVR